MPLRLYNTLTKREEEFVPLDPAGRKVTFYSCGPTVYDYAHIGNFRSFLNADLLRRSLEMLGYDVRHVMNMTDVGHMTDDEVADGAGEDKMEAAAKRLREAKKSGSLPTDAKDIDPNDPYAIAEFYIDAFLSDARLLGLKVANEQKRDPSLMPRPTQFVKQMIALIERLIRGGHAYEASDGVVYFDVQSFPEYGKLSGNTLDRLRAGEGGRVSEANQAVKKHPADFMLWKPDASHLMKWESPWGVGYPGWHLECSVMAEALLGEEIDIHSGGEDNIFPHHECEIAQTCAATGQAHFARYWFHTRHLFVEGEKMSKRKGTFFRPQDLMEKGASPAAIRLSLIGTHYRVNSNFTMQGLQDSQRRVERWMGARQGGEAIAGQVTASDLPPKFVESLSSDLNVSGAIAAVDEAVQLGVDMAVLDRMLKALGVLDLAYQPSTSKDAELIEAKIAERNAARSSKDWSTSDRIRDELKEMGIEIKDGPDGTTWKKIVS